MNKRHMNFQVLGRLLRYVLKHYKFSCLIVLVFIILSSVANVSVSLFIRVLIDDYITPLSQSPSPDFSSLLRVLLQMLCVFGMGVFANFAYQRILVNVGQGTLRNIRDDLFAHMEKLPIGYFDTHPHGDIMSVYTNDTDTLRQVITQSLPMTIQAAFNVLFVGTSMIVISLPLALLSFFMVGVMLTVARKIGGRSARNFQLQQKNLGRENGYIEEMLEGSKVIKVFTHEQEVIDGFNKINEDLFESSYKANMFASRRQHRQRLLRACDAGRRCARHRRMDRTDAGRSGLLPAAQPLIQHADLQHLSADECGGDGHGRCGADLRADG